MRKQKKRQRFFDKLRNKYRLVILNDETFEERASFRLSRFNVYVIVSTLFLLQLFLIYLLISFTPLKEFLLGYEDVTLRKNYITLKMKADSLGIVAAQQEAWIHNLMNKLTGHVDTSNVTLTKEEVNYDTIDLEKIPPADVRLREQMEKEQNYSLTFSGRLNKDEIELSRLNLFSPVKGYITAGFNPNEDHYGVDIVAPEKEPIKAMMDGYVIFATWTLETGYVIGIQHEYNLVSFYKHNSVLLKKVGNFVKAGDAIAIIGSSGELTTGPHLHFELWYDGLPVNPEDYIVF